MITINALLDGEGVQPPRFYALQADAGKGVRQLGVFEGLEDTALVLRYVTGANMRTEDQNRALHILRDYDKTVADLRTGGRFLVVETDPADSFAALDQGGPWHV